MGRLSGSFSAGFAKPDFVDNTLDRPFFGTFTSPNEGRAQLGGDNKSFDDTLSNTGSFLVRPIPEPSSVTLTALALLAHGHRRRRA